MLWNPRIMRSFILPKTRHSYISRLGLGFASKDNDYKVLIVNYDEKFRDLGLYSLKLNSWRSIGSAPDSYIIGGCFPNPPMVFAGGSLHYVETNFLQGGGISNSIVAFDLGNEVLRTIVLPETLRARGDAGHRRLSISEYNGSASIAVFARISYSCLHDIWVMREYGAEDSWLKLSFDDGYYHLPRMPVFYFKTHERVRVSLKDEGDYPHASSNNRVYPLAYEIDRSGTVSFNFGDHIKSIDDCRNGPLFYYKQDEGHEYYFYASRRSLALLDK